MKNRRLLVCVVLGCVFTAIYAAYLAHYFARRAADREKVVATLDFDVAELQEKLSCGESCDDDFLWECRQKAIALAKSGDAKAANDFLAALEKRLDGRDPEIVAWLYSTQAMLAETVDSPLEKLEFVADASDGFEAAWESICGNYDSVCIVVETYLSLPSFFTDQVALGFERLEELCEKIDGNIELTRTDKGFSQVRQDDFSYAKKLVEFAGKTDGLTAENAARLEKCKKLLGEKGLW